MDQVKPLAYSRYPTAMNSQLDVAMPFAGRTVLLAHILIDIADSAPERYIAKKYDNMHVNP